jgi:hypothetical protein
MGPCCNYGIIKSAISRTGLRLEGGINGNHFTTVTGGDTLEATCVSEDMIDLESN